MGVALGLLVLVTVGAPPVLASGPGKWNYAQFGADWGKEFPKCRGLSQTPINIVDKELAITGKDGLVRLMSYKPVDVEVFNNGGSGVQVNAPFGILRLPDGEYEAKQFHFHFPSEHANNGALAAGEMHIVHQRKGADGLDDLAVVGLLFDDGGDTVLGEEGSFMSKLGLGGSTSIPPTGQKLLFPKLDLNAFAPEFSKGFYHYTGSLTTPPCAETVHWYVIKKHVQLTSGMVDTWKKRFPVNNRQLMPINDRQIVLNKVDLRDEYIWRDIDEDSAFPVSSQ